MSETSVPQVGASVTRVPSPTYLGSLDFFELRPPQPLPRAGTLKAWVEGFAGKPVALCPDAALLGALLRDEQSARDWLRSALRVLESPRLVLETKAQLSPSQRSQAQLQGLAERARAAGAVEISWQPGGLWEPDAAAAFAERAELSLACDLLVAESTGPAWYGTGRLRDVRVLAAGKQARISAGAFDKLLADFEAIAGEPPRVSFDGAQSCKLAAQFQRFVRDPLAGLS